MQPSLLLGGKFRLFPVVHEFFDQVGTIQVVLRLHRVSLWAPALPADMELTFLKSNSKVEQFFNFYSSIALVLPHGGTRRLGSWRLRRFPSPWLAFDIPSSRPLSSPPPRGRRRSDPGSPGNVMLAVRDDGKEDQLLIQVLKH